MNVLNDVELATVLVMLKTPRRRWLASQVELSVKLEKMHEQNLEKVKPHDK